MSSAVLLGVGIASMHYVGMHGLSGNFAMTHDAAMVVLSVLIAIATAYGGLRAFLARQGGVQLALSAVAYGFAVSGMHYTAMAGMHLVPPEQGSHHHVEGLTASPQMLSLVVALLCFVIAAGFLLSLVPDPRKKATAPMDAAAAIPGGSYRYGGYPAGGLQLRDDQPAAPADAARWHRTAAPLSTRAKVARRGRRRHPFHRQRRRQERPGRRSLYKGA